MENTFIYQDTFNARVCSSGTWDDALEWVRLHHPAGTSNNWQKKTEPESAMPVICANDPKKKHYMFIC